MTGCFEKNKRDYLVSGVLNYLNKEKILKSDGGIPNYQPPLRNLNNSGIVPTHDHRCSI